MKRSDIDDGLVLRAAAAWQEDPTQPGVVAALIARGIPPKLAVAKVEHMVDRGLLECGVSVNYAWPRYEVDTCPRGAYCLLEHEWGHPCDRGENWDRTEACERPHPPGPVTS